MITLPASNLLRVLAASALLAGLPLAGAAIASPLSISTASGSAPAGTSYVDFNSITGNSGSYTAVGPNGSVNLQFSGAAAAVTGSVSGQYASPFGDTSQYLSTGIGAITIGFVAPQTYVGLLWGSVDSYNQLSFYYQGQQIAAITGGDITAGANGNQGAGGTYYVNITSSMPFDTVIASSSSPSFEFDNLAFGSTPVPEPATLAIFGVGLIGFVASRRRRRHQAELLKP